MRSAELEIWVRDVAAAVIRGDPVEDTKVELKATWIESEKAARQLAGHANASRGEPLLWLIGVDERNNRVVGVEPLEFEHWHKQAQKWFDGYAPTLVLHLNVRFGSNTVVCLYFETEKYSPYVITNALGGYPEFSVPWREGTRLRAARREDLLRMLLPIIKLPSIRLATAKLNLNSVPDFSSQKQKHSWAFEGFVYITPADNARLVIPYADCVIWIDVHDYQAAPYRLWTNFHETNYKIPKKPITHTIKIMGKDMDITPPPPRESLTITCADTEVIVDGPGSAFIVGSGFVLRDDTLLPSGNISIIIEITPSHSERKIIIERTLIMKPANNIMGTSSREWSL